MNMPVTDPQAEIAAPQSWGDLVQHHDLWKLVDACEEGAATDIRRRTVNLAQALASQRVTGLAELADDPWQDRTFAARMLSHVGALAAELPTQPPLLPAEVALLVTVPVLFDVVWAETLRRLREVRPEDLTVSQDATSQRAAFERYAQSQAQPYRRAVAATARGDIITPAEIGWWLLHRWAVRQPLAYSPELLTEVLGEAGADSLFAPARLGELLRAPRADAQFLARDDRADALLATGADDVRERLVGYLLVTAHALAIESSALPAVVGEHVGIGDPVALSELHHTVATARWRRRGAILVLNAACAHPAVEVALQAHTERLNHVLGELHRAAATDVSLASLRQTPTHVATDGLGAAEGANGPAYQSAGVRFRLAEDRVQELLMGEQLYGDPALAIRELYQNALDACRYRQARTDFLSRSGRVDFGDESWSGEVTFAQGVDESNRPYLDCVDNGIGMGVRELSEVFAQAGVRMSDLPEFLEEQAEWSRLDPPVQLFPNSRFGIGVLSYFMLADEITVETCRMGRDGLPGRRLQVVISGPGSLFRIRDLGPGTQTGSQIRLHLRPAVNVSCVDTLRELLWVAEFHTQARNGTDSYEWQPGQLSEATAPSQVRKVDGRDVVGVVPAAEVGVWWCREEGAVLADGLWAGQTLHGAVVNLTREAAPRLSVDRTKILAYRDEDVERQLWQAIPALTAAGPAILTFEWLYAFAKIRPLLADVIFEQAIAAGYLHWDLNDEVVDASIAGCFIPDGRSPKGPDQLVEWRLTALGAAGGFKTVVNPTDEWRTVVRAVPSDGLLVSRDFDAAGPWVDPDEPVSLSHIVRAARKIGRSPAEIVARFEALGYQVEAGAADLDTDPHDLIFTSRGLSGNGPWLDHSESVLLPHLMKAAHETGRDIWEIVARLRRLGFTLIYDLRTVPIDDFDFDDLRIVSRDVDGAPPWLDPAEQLSLLHLLRTSQKLNRDVSVVAARLGAWGYQLPAGCESLQVLPDDLTIVSRDLDARGPWLDPTEPVHVPHLLAAARTVGQPVTTVAERLVALGFTLSVLPQAIADIAPDDNDHMLISRDLDARSPWLSPVKEVSVVHLVRAAEATDQTVAAVAQRLTELGYRTVDPNSVLVDRFEPEDLTLISVDLDGEDPMLSPIEPVSAVHVILAARQLGRDVHQVIARLTVLGYSVNTVAGQVPVEQIEQDDLVLLSRDIDGTAPWISPDVPVRLPHLLAVARRTHSTIGDVAARLGMLGYQIDCDLTLVTINKIKSADLTMASTDLDGRHPWLNQSEPVPLAHLLGASRKLRRPVDQIVKRLSSMSYQVPDLELRLPRLRPGGL